MKIKILLALTVSLGVLLHAAPCEARRADVLLSPTRVVLEKGAKFATVTIRNPGDGAGRYKIDLVDAHMDENGGIKVLEAEAKEPFSAKDNISLSPRSLTLAPDENQPVRLLIKNMESLPDGEYRSHLAVRLTETDIDLKTGQPNPQGTSVVVRPKISTVIPVIIRKGDVNYTVTVEGAKIVMGGGDKQQKPEVQTTLGFSGNRSVLGDIKVTHVAADGKETQLAFFRGVAIYRGLTKRTQSVPLDVPAGVNIHAGKIQVAYMSQENEGSKVLSSKEITP